jgi:hypothetical protein
MSFVDDLADALARDVLAVIDEMDDDRFYEKVSRVLGASSPTLQEAFMTSVRIRLSERRGRKFFEDAVKAMREGGDAPEAPKDYSGGGH